MQLKWVNPWRFLAFRLFSWFWLVLLLTIAAAWLLAKAFLDDTVIRRLPHPVCMNMLIGCYTVCNILTALKIY